MISNRLRFSVALTLAFIFPQLASASLDRLGSASVPQRPQFDSEGIRAQRLPIDSAVSGALASQLRNSAYASNGTVPVLIASASGDDQPSKQSVTAPSLKTPDIGGTGTLDYSYDINVPNFHGVEPNLTINYASTRKTKTSGVYQGWLGYGWGIKGFDVIERARHKGTIPNLDKYDVFLLNGEELIPCVADSDPDTVETVSSVNNASCNSGGTHVSETENYLKIVAAGNSHWPTSWTITNREGTTMVLKPVSAFVTNPPDTPLANNARYLIYSITDTNGNQVLYDYTCPTVPVCYPKTISYNNPRPANPNATPTVIRFYLENRPDDIIAANGQNLSIIDQRIASIGIVTGSNVVAAYKFGYTTASTPGNGASRLTTISRYGSNAQIDSSGAITIAGGTLGPKATSFTYADSLGLSDTSTDTVNIVGRGKLFPVDVNSDGITEILENHDMAGDTQKCYRLFNLNSEGTFRQFNLSTLDCATVAYTLSSVSGGDSVSLPEFSLGHFATDLTKTQMLFRHFYDFGGAGSTVDGTVDTEAIFTRQVDGSFTVNYHTCADGNVTADQVIVQCGKGHPKTQVVDFDGNGRDNLQTTKDDDKEGGIGVVNLFDDGMQQQVFVRASGLKAKRRLPGASHTAPEMTTFKAGIGCPGGPLDQTELDYSKCEFADLNGDGLDDLVMLITHRELYNEHDLTCAGGGAAPCAYTVTLNVYLSLGRDDDANLTKVYTETLPNGRAYKLAGGSVNLRDLDGDGKNEVIIENTRPLNKDYDYNENASGQFSIRRLRLDSNGVYTLPEIKSISAHDISFGDFDGDGLIDYVSRNALRKGGADINPASYYYYEWDMMTFHQAQYDQDMKEAAKNTPYKLTRSKSSSSTAFPNLLTSVTTEMGAVSTFEYTASTSFPNTYLPFVVAAVTKVTVNDGRGNPAVTTYSYSGGLYNTVNRKFLGFRTSTKTLPKLAGETVSPTVVTTYRQDVASYGLPDQTVFYDGDGAWRKIVDETWSVRAVQVPYRAQNTETVTYLKEGNDLRAVKTAREFDVYGNILIDRNYGLYAPAKTPAQAINDQAATAGTSDADITGDGARTERLFNPNTTSYLVSLPYQETTYSGPNTSTTVLAQTQTWYEDATGAANSKPTKVNILKQSVLQTASVPSTTTFAYDGLGNKTVEETYTDSTSSDKMTWVYGDNQKVLPTEIHRKVNGTSTLDSYYSNSGICQQIWRETDPNGVITQHNYDEFCREIQVQNLSTNALVATTYNDDSNFTALASGALQNAPRIIVNTPLPDGTQTKTTSFYDGFGRTYLTRTDGDASSPMAFIQTVYDDRGNVAKTTLPFADDGTPNDISDNAKRWTVNNYDWNNRIVQTTNPDATVRTLAYALEMDSVTDNTDNKALGQVILTDELGRQTETTTSSDGDVILVRRKGTAAGDNTFVVQYSASYDPLRRLIKVKDADGANWSYAYDLAGNRTDAYDPDMGHWIYTYDLGNRLVTQKDARGMIMTLTYDRIDRVLTKTTYNPNTLITTPIVNNIYDEGGAAAFAIGQLTTATNGLASSNKDYASQAFTYDANGMVTKKVSVIAYNTNQAVTNTEETTYDPASKLVVRKKYYGDTGDTAATTPLLVGTATNKWSYNRKGQLIAIPDYITSTVYELDGQTNSITYANGASTNFTYDFNRRWLTELKTKSGTPVLLDNNYVRDAVGHIKAINGLSWTDQWAYTYDGRDRLTRAELSGNSASPLTENFSYTDGGNLTNRTRGGNITYPAATAARPHAIRTFTGVTFTYDANGNTLTDDKRTLTWDDANRLSTVKVSPSTATSRFVYGADGARVKKVPPSTDLTLYPDAGTEITRHTVSGVVTWEYTRYPHMDVKVVGAAKSFLHRDHLASVRLVTDSAGVKKEDNFYASYGEMVKSANNVGDPITVLPPTQKSYIGERFDFDTGLMYLNARYMNPVTGRFIPPDDGDPGKPEVDDRERSFKPYHFNLHDELGSLLKSNLPCVRT